MRNISSMKVFKNLQSVSIQPKKKNLIHYINTKNQKIKIVEEKKQHHIITNLLSGAKL